jgi:hypothetical protein
VAVCGRPLLKCLVIMNGASSLTRNSVLKIFRQLKPDASKEDQRALWDYVHMKASTHARTNMAKAIQHGGDRARSSVAQAVKEWQGQRYFSMNRNSEQHQQREGRGAVPAHQPQRAAQSVSTEQGSSRGSPQQRDAQGRGGSGLVKGKGGGINNGNNGGGGAQRGTTTGQAKGTGRGRTPWSELLVSDEAQLLMPDEVQNHLRPAYGRF